MSDKFQSAIKGLSPTEMAEMVALLDELEERKRTGAARADFLAFIALMDRTYKFGAHLRRLGSLLSDTEAGIKDRVAVSMAPRFGKSQMISIYFPAWYLGRNPTHKVIVASHTADLAIDMARKVRNLMQTAEYRRIFPEVSISADAKAAGKWNTNKGGEYFAVGVGGALAGRGGDLIIIDDPISEQDIKSGNFDSLDVVYEWFRAGLRTRLMPNGRIVTLHCLVGDTKIRQADGSEKLLRNIRPGDTVASYTSTGFVPAKVLGWANQGLDSVFSLTLRSGCTVRGNAQHPLLVRQNGEDRWVTIKDLKPGMMLVATLDSGTQLRDAPNLQKQKLVKVCDRHAMHDSRITKNIHKLYAIIFGPVKSGFGTSKQSKDAGSLRAPNGSVPLSAVLTKNCSAAPRTKVPTVLKNFVSRLLVTAEAFGQSTYSFATRAITSSKHVVLKHYYAKSLSKLSTTLDEIVSITPDGEEYVYDIQVAGTENFLANGIVSHNTRWHARDLIGRLLKDSGLNEDGDQYEMFEFPAILNADNPVEHPTNPPKSLWPEQWTLESLLRTKASMPLWQWNAQYMQNPTAADSAIVKRDWIKWWQAPNPPEVQFIVQSWDTALTTKERSDWSVCQTWGVWVDERDGSQNVILLNSAKGKWEFPDLKEEARRQYESWTPDSVIIEAKASGQPLIDEMRRSGIFVQDFSPGKGQDKIARLNAVADMFSDGRVWFPETTWAQEVVEEVIAFPSAEHDDAVDALTLALRRVRQGGLLRLSTDPTDTWEPSYRSRKGAYTV